MPETESREEFLNRVEQKAMENAPQWKHCAQATLSALSEEFDIPGADYAIKAATFMAGGTAELGNTCGALNGAMMALGLIAGRCKSDEPKFGGPELNESSGVEKRLEYSVKLFQRFMQENGTWICRDIIMTRFGKYFDLLNDHESFVEAGSSQLCPGVIGKAVRAAAETIMEMKDEGLVE